MKNAINMRYNPKSNLLPAVINKAVDCIVGKFVLLELSDPCLAFLLAFNVVLTSQLLLVIYGLTNFEHKVFQLSLSF